MADMRILRFRRRARDGSTHPLLSPRQADAISDELLAGERQARASTRRAARPQPFPGVPDLADVAPARRAEIVAAARRNVNSRWSTGLVILVPIALYGAALWIWGGTIGGPADIALPLVVFLPAFAVHARLVRREIRALMRSESTGP